MSNNLKSLRKEADVTTRDMKKYTGISNSITTYLENGKRPFRQTHINALTSFFNVSADYLLGRSDYGIIVFPEYDDKPITLTAKEYDRLREHITIEIHYVGDAYVLPMNTTKEEQEIVFPEYQVYRELKGRFTDYDLGHTLSAKLNELSKHMDTDELERTIRFIEDYILKK